MHFSNSNNNSVVNTQILSTVLGLSEEFEMCTDFVGVVRPGVTSVVDRALESNQ